MSGERMYVVRVSVDPRANARGVEEVRPIKPDDFHIQTVVLVRARDELEAMLRVQEQHKLGVDEFIEALGEWY